MRRNTWIPVLTAAVLLLASAAEAQTRDWYLLLVGQAGPISANSGTIVTGVTDQTIVLSYGQNFFLPLDSMGTPGPLEFRPLRVLKEVDGSSPRIAQALANGEQITSCVLTLYEWPGGGGSPSPVYEILLGTPKIIGVSGGGDSMTTPGGTGSEVVSILFQSLKLTDAASGQTTTIP